MRKLVLFVIGFILVHYAAAQDPQFSQYYNAPLYLNPGFTGATAQQRVTANHRLQWPNLPQVFSTFAASYELFIGALKSGIGLMATTDKMGTGGWRTTTAGLLYSYKVQLNQGWVFSPGIYFGYGFQGIDQNRLLLGDELAADQSGTNDPLVYKVDNAQYFDIGTGMVLYNRLLWLGISAYHMNRPNISLVGNESRLPMKVNVHAGMRIPLTNSIRSIGKSSYITPGFVYRKQGNTFSQLDVGVNYHIDPISVGIWYRGVPLKRSFQFLGSEDKQVQQDAMVFSLSLLFNSFQIGYSYDFTISELSTAAGGAHEVSIIYEFAAKSNATVKRQKLLPCPTFKK